jgi:hypothetical protein
MEVTPEMILGGIHVDVNLRYPRAKFTIGRNTSDEIILASRDLGIVVKVKDGSILLYSVCNTLDMSVPIYDPVGFKKLMTRLKFLTAKYYGRPFEKIVADTEKLTSKEVTELIRILSDRLDRDC